MTYIGIADGEMHPQPWILPDCVELENIESTPYDVISGIADRANAMFKQDLYLENVGAINPYNIAFGNFQSSCDLIDAVFLVTCEWG